MSDPQILVRKKRAYSAVPDDILTNKSLSVSARLVLAYMIGRPDGWVIYVSQVCSAIGIGTGGQWRRVRNELENAGFFIQTRTRGADGKIKWHHEVTDVPTILSKPTDGESIDGGAIHGERQDITIGLEQGIKQRIAAAPRACAHGCAAATLRPDKYKSRRQRQSGIVTWSRDDELEAERIEKEHTEDEIGDALTVLAGAGKQPVPGLVAGEIERQKRTKKAADRAIKHRATATRMELDPGTVAKGKEILPAGLRQRLEPQNRPRGSGG